MSRKIERIEIEAFRAYKEKETFDMNVDGQVANLIVLYAPNGSGKTSFFDAVEWAISGEIKRISENHRVKEIADMEKGHILKNKYSNASVGVIEIKFSDQERIKIATKEIKGNRKTDYAAGNEISITSQIKTLKDNKIAKAIQKNILTHDQVDKFLRFQTSRERYEALKIFWDFNDDTGVFKNLIIILNELEIQKKEVKEKYDSIVKDLEKLKFDREVLNRINTRIAEINDSFTNTDEKGIYLIAVESDGVLENILSECIKIKTQTDGSLGEVKNNLNIIQYLFNNYSKNYRQPNEYIKNIYELELKKAIIDEDNLKTLTKKEEERKRKVVKQKDLGRKITDISVLMDNFKILSDLGKEKSSLEKSENKLLMDRESTGTNLIKIEEELFKKNNLLVEKQRNLKVSIENMTDLDFLKEKISSAQQKEEVTKEAQKLEFKINDKKELVLNYELEKKKYIEILQRELTALIKNNISYTLSNKVQDSYMSLVQIHTEIDELSNKIVNHEIKIEVAKKIGNDISKMKKMAVDILNTSKNNVCPLCNNTYEDFDILLERVNQNSEELVEINNLINEVNSLKKEKAILLFKAEEIYDRFVASINNEIRILDDILIEMNSQIKTDELSYYNAVQKLNEIEKDIKQQKIVLEKLQISNKEKEINKLYNVFREYKKNLQEEINVTQKECILIEGQVKEAQHQLKINDELLKQNKVLMQKLLNNHLYATYLNVSNELGVKELKDIKSEYSKLKIELEESNIELKYVDMEIDDCKNKVGDLKLADVKNDIKNIQEKGQKVQDGIDLYIERFIKYFGHEKIREEILEQEVYYLKDRIERLSKKAELLLEIINILSPYLTNSMKRDKQKECKLLKDKLDYFKTIIEELTVLKDESHFYIKEKIEQVFNLKSVNKIFQMIDPHPKMTDIIFKLDESVKDSLGLNIMCKDHKKPENIEAPILYLSSAQVNILSLSIFLASAIENSQEFNTILMDDPIQHLDGLNILSFIDLLRIICFSLNKQIILSTHDERFFKLLQKKIDSEYFPVKYVTLNKRGSIVHQ
ncbi:AAA family ATPase [Bacillus cereus]|nr:AAA family ATPase [Bacillus cereus]MDA2456080.1 AAA family ATPase [Bacillus cereus]